MLTAPAFNSRTCFNNPPGKPGIKPHWTSSAKSGVGTAIDAESRVWFSVAYGILDEIYHPFIDSATTRDFGFIVVDGLDFFSEEKRDTHHEIRPLEQGVPGYRLTNTCKEGRYRITKTIVTDPRRDVLLQHLRFEALQGELADYTLYALLNPHIGNHAMGNDGWAGDFCGIPMLFAQREATVLALASFMRLDGAVLRLRGEKRRLAGSPRPQEDDLALSPGEGRKHRVDGCN